jgi:Arc/MetJ family transcription regulator
MAKVLKVSRSRNRVRKNIDIDASKLRAAKKILGARTDTETVDRALDHIVYTIEVFAALDRLAALGGIDDIYAEKKTSRVPKVAEP